MGDSTRKRGLGRGLSSLLDGTATVSERISGLRMAPIEMVRPNPDQPRKVFPKTEMEELAESIRRNGLIQPLIVRADQADSQYYQIVAGERRWRAAQVAGLHELPVVLRELSDEEVLQVAIVENVQRVDLNPIEEAHGYRRLIETFGHSQAEVARAVGKSRPHIANILRLLSLPDEVIELVLEKRLSSGHARALVNASDPISLARRVAADHLTVRQTEELARRVPLPKARAGRVRKDPDTAALEADLAAALSLSVSISHRGEGGDLKISYDNLDELDRLCQFIMR